MTNPDERLFASARSRLKIAITGAVHSGKTSLAAAWAAAFKDAGIACGGILERAVFQDKTRIGYDFESVLDGSRFPFARRQISLSAKAAENPSSALSFANKRYAFNRAFMPWLEEHFEPWFVRPEILFYDEIGLLEAEKGDGIMPYLKRRLAHPKPYRGIICICRASCLDIISEAVGGFDKTFFVSDCPDTLKP